MSDYTPNVDDMRAAWVDYSMVSALASPVAEFDRFINKVKADALREAAREMRSHVERATGHQRYTEHELIEHDVEHVLNEYADRIENGDGQ